MSSLGTLCDNLNEGPTLTEALRLRGLTHRPATIDGCREIVASNGAVVFTGRAAQAWDWLARFTSGECQGKDCNGYARESVVESDGHTWRACCFHVGWAKAQGFAIVRAA